VPASQALICRRDAVHFSITEQLNQTAERPVEITSSATLSVRQNAAAAAVSGPPYFIRDTDGRDAITYCRCGIASSQSDPPAYRRHRLRHQARQTDRVLSHREYRDAAA